MAKEKKFYEAQQYAGGGRWNKIGYFTTKKLAEQYCEQFNTKIVVADIRVVERSFLA